MAFSNVSSPDLAVQISSNLLNQVNIYNLTRRQEQAAGEKAFVQRQVDEKRAELRQAESELRQFLESNRMYAQSPELILERTRLQRAVDMRNILYTSMLQSYEAARIDEMRDLPVISIIEPPEMPIQNDPRGGARKTLIGLAIVLVLGIVIAFFREKMAANKEAQTDEFVEFSELHVAAREDHQEITVRPQLAKVDRRPAACRLDYDCRSADGCGLRVSGGGCC